MSNGNGPDRELGEWHTAIGSVVLSLHAGVVSAGANVSPAGSLAQLLSLGSVPLDTTAKREAIRAGWRELDGRWVKDEREPWLHMPRRLDLSSYSKQDAYEAAAKARSEWPGDEPAPEAQPEPALEVGPDVPRSMVSRDAERALAVVWGEAYNQGRKDEHEALAKQAKPCVLKRLQAQGYTEGQALAQVESHELTARAILWLLLGEAHRAKVDLSDLAERMAGGQG